jgi:acylphosphatase
MRLHIFVSGIVQGVFYRQFTVEAAQSIGITGWVKNTKDKRVEIVAEGNYRDMVAFITKLKQGPEDADVADIIVEEEQVTGEFKSFEKK